MIRLRIKAFAQTRKEASERAAWAAGCMASGTSSINSHGPRVNLFADVVTVDDAPDEDDDGSDIAPPFGPDHAFVISPDQVGL